MKSLRLALALTPFLFVASAPALTFNLLYADGTSQLARDGFAAAAARFSSRFSDPITVNLNVGTVNLVGSGILGYADSPAQSLSYSSVRGALAADATTATDATAVSNLAASPTIGISTNYFANNPNANRATPFNTTVSSLSVNYANAKALGLRNANDPAEDGLIRFNAEFNFDYNPDDGIASGAFDFVGIATHEIGHALGFVSGADYADELSATSTTTTNDVAFVTPLDLFRRSGATGIIDVTANANAKYMSLDNGVTGQARGFSLGANRGDGRQASHWKDGQGIGILDPTFGGGELGIYTANDNFAFDAMGYTPVPEPATLAALGFGALALQRRRRR